MSQQHVFKAKVMPSKCRMCGDMIWNARQEARQCGSCKLVVHSKCLQHVNDSPQFRLCPGGKAAPSAATRTNLPMATGVTIADPDHVAVEAGSGVAVASPPSPTSAGAPDASPSTKPAPTAVAAAAAAARSSAAMPPGATVTAFEEHHVKVPDGDATHTLLLPRGLYCRVQYLASGFYGSVCSARRIADGQKVVIKRQLVASSRTAESALRELDVLAHLTVAAPHRNLIRLEDTYFTHGNLYLIEEALDLDLWDLMDRYDAYGGVLPPAYREAIMIGLLAGLVHLHRCGVVHRDLKPGNIVLRPGRGSREPRLVVKIIDMGCGRPVTQSVTMRFIGTCAYSAPEQLQNAPYDHAIDVWAAGCVLAEMVLGSRLFPDHAAQLPPVHTRLIKELSQRQWPPQYAKSTPQQLRAFGLDACIAWPADRSAGRVTPLEARVLSGLLHPDPKQRLTAAAALELYVGASGLSEWVAPPLPMRSRVYQKSDVAGIQAQMRKLISDFNTAVPRYGRFAGKVGIAADGSVEPAPGVGAGAIASSKATAAATPSAPGSPQPAAAGAASQSAADPSAPPQSLDHVEQVVKESVTSADPLAKRPYLDVEAAAAPANAAPTCPACSAVVGVRCCCVASDRWRWWWLLRWC